MTISSMSIVHLSFSDLIQAIASPRKWALNLHPKDQEYFFNGHKRSYWLSEHGVLRGSQMFSEIHWLIKINLMVSHTFP